MKKLIVGCIVSLFIALYIVTCTGCVVMTPRRAAVVVPGPVIVRPAPVVVVRPVPARVVVVPRR